MAEATMNRELLERAAKAAGLLPLPEGKELDYSADGGLTFSGGGEYTKWNPLTDDGDAFRLVVKLAQMGVWRTPMTKLPLVGWDDDACAAARLAIVRAAAEIWSAT